MKVCLVMSSRAVFCVEEDATTQFNMGGLVHTRLHQFTKGGLHHHNFMPWECPIFTLLIHNT